MDWSAINWLNLSGLTASAFLAALIGSFIGRRHYALTAFLSALLFAAIYIGWFGYLKQQEPTDQQTKQPSLEAKPARDEPATEPVETEATAPAEEPAGEGPTTEKPPAEEAEEP